MLTALGWSSPFFLTNQPGQNVVEKATVARACVPQWSQSSQSLSEDAFKFLYQNCVTNYFHFAEG